MKEVCRSHLKFKNSMAHILQGASARRKNQAGLKELIKLDVQQASENARKGCCFVRDLFLQLYYGGQCISIRKADFRLNAAHILHAIGIPRPDLVTSQLRKSGVPYDVVKAGRGFQGTYIDFERGLQWCKVYAAKDLQTLLVELLKAYRQHLEELNQATNLLPNVLPCLASLDHYSVSKPELSGEDITTQEHASYTDCRSSTPLIEGLLIEDSRQPRLLSSATCHERLQLDDDERESNAENIEANTQGLEWAQKRSVFTEPSYSHGSYLPRMKDHSYTPCPTQLSGPASDYGQYTEPKSFLSYNMADKYVFDQR